MAVLSPFVMKIHYYLPTTDNQIRNRENIRYIIREGAVDYGEIEPEDREKVKVAKQELKEEQAIHAQYMHERPRSSGLFDNNGAEVDVEEIKKTMETHSGIVWRCIVSLREDEAARLNHLERNDWHKSLQGSMAEIQEKLGISENNFRWVAAYHPEPGHPHCHILFWEDNPVRTQGKLSDAELKDLKRSFVKNIYSKERERLLIEKTYYRDSLREGVRDILRLRDSISSENDYIKAEIGDKPKLAPKLLPEQGQQLSAKLEQLTEILPGHGRVALKYMPEEVKTEVREVADWIIDQPGFRQAKEGYLQANYQIISMYMHDQPKQIQQAMDRAYNDLRDRIAQDVLKAAAKMQNMEQEIQYREQMSRDQFLNSVWKGAWLSIQREKTKSEYQAIVMQKEYEQEEKRKEGRQR